jgi:CDP-glucose 4,6-dehydratase
MAEDQRVVGEAFNFSNETQVSVKELVSRISRLMGSALEPDVRNEAQNEIVHQYLSAKKARELLGWKPAFELESGLKETIAWYREYLAR